MLSLDWNLLFTVVNLVIFYILMKKFVWNKVLGAMDKRQSKIDQQFKDADEDRRAAGALKTEYEGRLAGADEESARLIADAKVTAKAKADKIVDQAKLTSDKMVRDAHQTIEHERNEALQSVKHDMLHWQWTLRPRWCLKRRLSWITARSMTIFWRGRTAVIRYDRNRTELCAGAGRTESGRTADQSSRNLAA